MKTRATKHISIYIYFFEIEYHSVVQAGMLWCHLSSLKPPPPVSISSPASASQLAVITGMHHHYVWIIFVLFLCF